MKIKNYLEKNEIEFEIFEHPEVYNCEEAEKYCKEMKATSSKNLFLKGKKSKKFYLIILPSKEKLNLKKLEKEIDEKIEFANEKELKKILDVKSGAVSPFALINDKEKKVEILIDEKIWQAGFVGFHPNINTQTWELNKKDFQKYIKLLGNKFKRTK